MVKKMNGTVDCTLGAPYFTPSNCRTRTWTGAQAAACLQGVRVFILGNSVARNYAYELGSLFDGYIPNGSFMHDGRPLDRVQQKQACAKAPRTDQAALAQSCVVDFHPITSVSFMWRQWFMQPPPTDTSTAAEGDFCLGADPIACLRDFLAPSRTGDMLIVSLGLAYARYLPRHLDASPAMLQRYIRCEAWAFVEAISRLFRGSSVLVVNTTPMMREDPGPSPNKRAVIINAAESAVFHEAGWPVLDQWSINWGQWKQYADHVHFPTAPGACLTQAMWQHALSLVCPLHLGTWVA